MGSKKSSSSSSTTSNNYNQQAQLSNNGSGTIINLAGAMISQSDTGAGVGTGGGAAVHVEQLSDDLVQTAFDWAGNVVEGTHETIVDTQNTLADIFYDSQENMFDTIGGIVVGTQESMIDAQNRMTAAVSDSVNAAQAVSQTVASNLSKDNSAEILKIALMSVTAVSVIYFLFKNKK